MPHIAVGDRKQERRALSVHVPATHLVKEKELKEVRVTLEIKTDNRHTNTHARTTHLFYKHSAPTHRERERDAYTAHIFYKHVHALRTRFVNTHRCTHADAHTHNKERENVEFTSLTVQKSRSGENENTRGPCIGMLPRWEQNRETKTRENCLPFGQAVREVHFGQCMRDEVGRGNGTRGIALTSKKQTSVFLDVHQSC